MPKLWSVKVQNDSTWTQSPFVPKVTPIQTFEDIGGDSRGDGRQRRDFTNMVSYEFNLRVTCCMADEWAVESFPGITRLRVQALKAWVNVT
jgi:hypothetical protein